MDKKHLTLGSHAACRDWMTRTRAELPPSSVSITGHITGDS